MAFIHLCWIMITLLPLVAFLGLYLHFKVSSSRHWEKRKIPYLKPIFLLGNLWKANITENVTNIMADIHLENREKKILGLWMYHQPRLMIMDLELAKRVLVKDFNVFRDRGLIIEEEMNPLAMSLVVLSGKKWRNLRVKLTPTFTSGKMKFMFPTMVECGDELEKYLGPIADKGETVEVKDLTSRFGIDIISSCAFGLVTNSLKNPNSEFRQFSNKIFPKDAISAIKTFMALFYPKIAKLLSIRFIPKDVAEFFVNIVQDTVEYRERNNIARNDFLQLLIQLIRAGKIEDADKETIDGEDVDDEALTQKFSLVEAAAQCFVFFGAGFENSSAAMTFALYELARNPEIQSRLQEEVDEKTKNGLTYEAIMEMKYLDMVIDETLRKYPPFGSLSRRNVVDYHIPELGVTLEKGTSFLISVKGFHYDPDLYPDPERFDPERFSEGAKSLRDNVAFMPFGHGPRNCIGNRFALMQMKIGLISILKSFNVEMATATPSHIRYHVRALSTTVAGGMPLAFTRRKNSLEGKSRVNRDIAMAEGVNPVQTTVRCNHV